MRLLKSILKSILERGNRMSNQQDWAAMTPKEIVEYFGLLDEIKLDNDIGTTNSRVVAALLVVAASLLLLPIGARMTSIISESWYAQLFGGVALWLGALSVLLPQLIVSVPEITGLVTVNLFSGTMHAFGTGFQVKYLWEHAKASNFINLRLVPSRNIFTFISRDGVEITYTYVIQYRGRLRLLPIYIRVDKEDIDEALGAIVRFTLSQHILSQTADELRTSESIKVMEAEVSRELGRDLGHEIEFRYGIDFEVFSLSEPTFGKDYVEATTAVVVTDKLEAAARKLRDPEGLGLTGQSAIDVAMMLNKENVSREVKGLEATDLASIFQKTVNDAVNTVMATIAKRR